MAAQFPPGPAPFAPAKRGFPSSGKSWLIIGLAAVCGSCLLCGGGFALLALFSHASETAPALAPPPGATPEAALAASPAPSAPDDFLYHAPNGAQFIPPLTVVARGAKVTLAGAWRDDHRNFLLALAPDGNYRCEDAGSSGNSAAATVETGQWSLLAGALHLVPASLTLHAVSGLRQITENHPPGPPRDMSVEGLSLEYTPYDQPAAPPRKIDGLALDGDVPDWAYEPNGRWHWQLRRAP